MNTRQVSTGATEPEGDALADELLAIRCQLGEPAALDALVERWHLPLWKYVRRFASDDTTAADVLQDVWLRVLRAMPALRDPTRLRAWLFGIARRAVMDRLRDEYAEPAPTHVNLEDIAEPDDVLSERSEEIGLMHDALARMPALEREVLVLFYLRELSLNQLADVLAVPVGTIKSRLFRARHLLRRELTTKGIVP